MAINATDQGERNSCFYIRSPLLLKSSMFFLKIALGGHYNHVKIWQKNSSTISVA